MKTTSRPLRILSAFTAALALAVAVSGLGVGTAQAGKIRPPAPIPTVPAPAGVQILSITANEVVVTEVPASGYVLAVRYVSGPVPPFDLVFPIGATSGESVRITGLVPDSDYVFEMRRVSIGGRLVNSGFTRFTFRTKSLAASQPAAPVISVGAVTATFVVVSASSDPQTVMWFHVGVRWATIQCAMRSSARTIVPPASGPVSSAPRPIHTTVSAAHPHSSCRVWRQRNGHVARRRP